MKLKELHIPDSAKTDLGLKHYLAAIEPRTALYLSGWRITDAGLKELAGKKQLLWLDLGRTQVTDAGLKELAGLKQLQFLDLVGTRVTDAGVAELRKHLPRCWIDR
jgi:hypothetical protein